MKKIVIMAAALVALSASVSMASVMVSWGNGATDIVVAAKNMTGMSSTPALSLSAYANPALDGSYYPNHVSEGASPNFYGATTGDRFQVSDGGAGVDALYTRNAYNGVIYLWNQDLFLNGGNTGSVTLTGMSATSADNGSTVATTTRFVIRLGSAFYISQTFGEGVQSFTNASSLVWYNYDVSTYSTIGSQVALTDFSNLTAAGVYLDVNVTSGTAATYLRDFSVTATMGPDESAAPVTTNITASLEDTYATGGNLRITTDTSLRIGQGGTANDVNSIQRGIIPFLLPTLAAGETISAARLTFEVVGDTYANLSSNDKKMDVGLAGLSTNPAVRSEYATNCIDVATGVFNLNKDIVNGVYEVQLTDLPAYLNNTYDGTGGQYVFLTLTPDGADARANSYVSVASANHTTAVKPSLALDISSGGTEDYFYDPDGIFTNVPNIPGSLLNTIRNLQYTTGSKINKASAPTYQNLVGLPGVTDDGEYIIIDDNFAGTNGGWLEGYNLEGRAVHWMKHSSCLIRNCFFGEGNNGWISSDGIHSGGTAYLWIHYGQLVEIRNNTFEGKEDFRGKSYAILTTLANDRLIISGNHFTKIPSDQIVINNGSTNEPMLFENNYFQSRRLWPDTTPVWDANATYQRGDLVVFPQGFTWPGGQVSGGGDKLLVALVDGVGGYASLPDNWTTAESNTGWFCPDPHNDGINIRASAKGTVISKIMMDFTLVNGPLWLTPNTGDDPPMKDIFVDSCVIINQKGNKGISWNPQASTNYNGIAIKDCWFWIGNNNYFQTADTSTIHTVEDCVDLKTGLIITNLPSGFVAP